jgi:transcriptional regulator with XRE-family HTH domain
MNLAEYVAQVMKDKNITAVEIQKRSEGVISDSHVANILKGKTTNLTIEKINALAKGLQVDSVEVFKIASGQELVENKEEWPGHTILRVMERIIQNPDLTKLVKAVVKLKPAKVKAILKSLEKD